MHANLNKTLGAITTTGWRSPSSQARHTYMAVLSGSRVVAYTTRENLAINAVIVPTPTPWFAATVSMPSGWWHAVEPAKYATKRKTNALPRLGVTNKHA